MKTQTTSPWTVVREFRRAVEQAYGERLRAMALYGSLARGEWTPDSDIDVLVLLDNGLDIRAERDRVWRLAWELNHRHDTLLAPLVLPEDEYRRGAAPIFLNIRREGIFIMVSDEPSNVEEMMQKARSDLEEARLLLQQGHPDGAVSRAYYAMFNAAQSALAARGIARSKHRGVVAVFGFEFVRTGQVPKELQQALEVAYEKRLLADYSPHSVPSEDAEVVMRDAEAMLQVVERLLAREAE